jgi:hypothetical protein
VNTAATLTGLKVWRVFGGGKLPPFPLDRTLMVSNNTTVYRILILYYSIYQTPSGVCTILYCSIEYYSIEYYSIDNTTA